ncbi:MAG: hypothetical protein L6R36_009508, partial [Xanthoria steineri]
YLSPLLHQDLRCGICEAKHNQAEKEKEAAEANENQEEEEAEKEAEKEGKGEKGPTNSRPPRPFTPKNDTMHRPPQLPPFGDVVVRERARAAFGEDFRVVEVYHCDGEDAGACISGGGG